MQAYHDSPDLKLNTVNFRGRYEAVLGVHSFERLKAQILHIEMQALFEPSLFSHNDMVAKIDDLIKQTLVNVRPFLIEKLAFVLATLLFDSLPYLCSLNLTIRKPEALAFAKDSNVNVVIIKDDQAL